MCNTHTQVLTGIFSGFENGYILQNNKVCTMVETSREGCQKHVKQNLIGKFNLLGSQPEI